MLFRSGTTAEPDSTVLAEEFVAPKPVGAPEILPVEVEPVMEPVARIDGFADEVAHRSVTGRDSFALPETAGEQFTSAVLLNITPEPVTWRVDLSAETMLVQASNRVRVYRPAIQLQPPDQSVEDILALAVLNLSL